MLRFLLQRLGMVIPTFIGVSIVSFLFIRLLPGDPILLQTGLRNLTDERYAKLMAQFGYDQPLWLQYKDYLVELLRGDLGTSFTTRKPVWDEFFSLFPATVELSFCAMLFAVLVGLPAGIIAAMNRGKWPDLVLMSSALVGFSMPIFWWALILIIVFSGTLGWTPVSGRISTLFYFPNGTGFMLIDSFVSDQPGAFRSALSHLILPTIALGTIPLAIIARQTRSAMLEVLSEDYIRTAHAKGLHLLRVNGLHALRNAFIPIVTVIGLLVGTLLGGVILTETIFAWPGIGKWMLDAISRRDYPSVQGGLILISAIVIFVNLAVDVLYGILNPKMRSH